MKDTQLLDVGDGLSSSRKKPAGYAVSGADWLLLVEKLGLTGQLEST